jgi:hypothetical protein
MLAAGVPAAVCVGAGATLTLSLLIGRYLPGWAFAALWLAGASATCLLLWLLVARCVEAERWRALLPGVGVLGAAAAASWILGALTQALRPGVNGMAGIGWIIIGYVLAAATIVELAMGAIAIRLVAGHSASLQPASADRTSAST